MCIQCNFCLNFKFPCNTEIFVLKLYTDLTETEITDYNNINKVKIT